MKNYNNLINKLKQKKQVPDNLFNKIYFSIQNKQKSKTLDFKKLYIKPIHIGVAILFIAFQITTFMPNKALSDNEEFLISAYDNTYYDRFFANINEDFIVWN
jgi:hypothetical protein